MTFPCLLSKLGMCEVRIFKTVVVVLYSSRFTEENFFQPFVQEICQGISQGTFQSIVKEVFLFL